MTSASELFCSRRTRLGRGSEDLELESNLDLSRRSRHFERQQSSRRNGLDGGSVPTSRSSRMSAYAYRSCFVAAHFEVYDGTRQHSPGCGVDEEGLSARISRPTLTCGERLPGAVLQARDRLFQRLRGSAVSHSSSRRPPSNVFNDEFRLVDAGDWDSDIIVGLAAGEGSSSSSISHSEQCKKPLGLPHEVLDSLPIEIFGSIECGCSTAASDDKLVSCDCSICLEKFSDGNELVRLPCSHMFHQACLGQWGQIRGDCPCCRRSII